MTATRPTLSASWNSGTTRLRGKHSTLPIHSSLPHRALNGWNGWTHSLEAPEFATISPGRSSCKVSGDMFSSVWVVPQQGIKQHLETYSLMITKSVDGGYRVARRFSGTFR